MLVDMFVLYGKGVLPRHWSTIMTQTSFDQRLSNDLRGLSWLTKFGWLRTAELGRLMWPSDTYARTKADRVARGWIKRSLVITRQLPDGAGRALVLSEAGSRLLKASGHSEARSGKDWGETGKEGWRPNSDWRHDLIAAGVLVRLHEQGYQVIPERELRQANPGLTKIPDGLAVGTNTVFWLEVEHARKSGNAMKELATVLCAVASGAFHAVSGHQPTAALVAYADLPDERGYRLDHRARVLSSVRRIAQRDLSLNWAVCKLSGCGVMEMTMMRQDILADLATRILDRLNASGWKPMDGCLVSYYGGKTAYVWEEDGGVWGFEVEGVGANRADSKSLAMRGCASLLSSEKSFD